MTTLEPGAKLVFTQGRRASPLATALRANRPAPIITEGFDVLVQLVIAAMTTSASSNSNSAPSNSTGTGAEAESQPHPLPWRSRSKPPLAWAGQTSQARQRHPVHLQHRVPHTCRTSCGNDLGPAAQARFNGAAIRIDIEVCGRCGGSVRVIACIEDQDIIDRILTHLRQKEQETPTRPLLVPPTRAPPGTLPLFAGKDSSTTALHQQGSQ